VNRSMMHRKTLADVKTESRWPIQDKLGRRLAFCPGGIRCIGGVTFAQGFMWNAGTCRFNVKGEIQVGGPHENESTDVKNRGGPTRSSDETSVMGVERRGRVVQYCLSDQPSLVEGIL